MRIQTYIKISTWRAFILAVSIGFVWPASMAKGAGLCGSGECDVIWAINKRVDDGIKSKSKAMAAGVREEFERAMHLLFDEKLKPLLNDFDGILQNRTAQIEKIVNSWLDRVDEIVNATAARVIDKVRDDIIMTASSEADKLTTKIRNDVLEILDRLSCELDGTIEAAASSLSDLIPKFSGLFDRFDACMYRDNVYIGNPSAKEYGKIYSIQSCLVFREISEARSSARTILAVYVDLSNLARRARCVIKTPVGDDFYGRELQKWQYRYQLWLRAGAR